ncbi:MAG: hypothetical protein HQL50_03400 [Magnetococcales bacterium]|nr:hypothetical protein [Magnetococcales bacterium]
MWIFLEGGRFLSIAADPDDAQLVRVRARLPGDIETDFPDVAVREHPPEARYRFEAVIPRARVLAVIRDELDDLAYPGVSKTVCNRNRVNAISRCDQVLLDAQETARRGDEQEGLCHL